MSSALPDLSRRLVTSCSTADRSRRHGQIAIYRAAASVLVTSGTDLPEDRSIVRQNVLVRQ
jgi:hypothetical protein